MVDTARLERVPEMGAGSSPVTSTKIVHTLFTFLECITYLLL